MPVTIELAGEAIPTKADALKSFQTDETLLFSLGAAWLSVLNLTLDRVPSTFENTNVSYNGPAVRFRPAGGPVNFGLQTGVAGTLELKSSGTLVTYNDGLDSPQSKIITIPSGTVYLSLTLAFNIAANASGSYSGGAYGVRASLDTNRTYSVSFHKAFTSSTPVRLALAQVFESFVLPLHRDTFSHLSEGDYLLHDFDGNLHLSFGAYTGLEKVLYAGQCSADVMKTFGSPLATFSVQSKPEIKAGASLDFSLQYANHFEALLSRSASAGHLHLFRSSKTHSSAVLNAGLTFDGNTSFKVGSGAQNLQDSLISAAGGSDALGGKAISQILAKAGAAGELEKYAAEATDKLNAWASHANGIQANLEVAIETQRTRTLLAGYTLELGSPAFETAWQAAYNGDLVAALKSDAVILDAGSGLEQEYQRKTSFHCNIFNLWNISSWDQFSTTMSLVYAGHNSFHLVSTVGHEREGDSVGTMRSLDLYFTAAADIDINGLASGADINLHLDLTAKGDRKATDTMATLLAALEAGPVVDGMARDMRAFARDAKRGTSQLKITISPSSYGRITCDPYDDKGRSLTTTFLQDANNWGAFSKAADDLKAWPLSSSSAASAQALTFLKTFAAWETLNVAATGAIGPNRTQMGNAYNQWPETFPQVEAGHRALIVYSMLAGQAFMNFCAALRTLANVAAGTTTNIAWTELQSWLTTALKYESDIDFIRPAALAVLRLCGSAPAVAGPTSVTMPTGSFAVTITA